MMEQQKSKPTSADYRTIFNRIRKQLVRSDTVGDMSKRPKSQLSASDFYTLRPTYSGYKNATSQKAFLMSFNKKPFSISRTQLLNKKRIKLDVLQKNPTPLDYYTYKKQIIKTVQFNRELSPHKREVINLRMQPKLEYRGLMSSTLQMDGYSKNLLQQIKKMSANPLKPNRKRLFQSNFNFGKGAFNSLTMFLNENHNQFPQPMCMPIAVVGSFDE